jgi:hypothetical protein
VTFMETFAVARSIFFRSIYEYNGSPFRAFPYRPGCVLPRAQCHPAPEGAVLVVRPLRDIVVLMSGILISVPKVYSSKVFGISLPGRPPSWIRYSLFISLPRVPSVFHFSRRRAQTRSRAAINTEHTSTDEYAVLTCKSMMMFRLTITPNVL